MALSYGVNTSRVAIQKSYNHPRHNVLYLEGLVPGPSHDTGVGRSLDKVTCLDWCVVSSHLHGLVASQVPALHHFVTRCHEHLCPILTTI